MVDSEYWFKDSLKSPNVEDLYEIDREIAKGTTSSVCYSKLRGSMYEYAVKIIMKTENRKYGSHEIGHLMKLNHQNIVRLKEVFENKSHLYLVMEYVKGGELFDRIVSRGYYSERDASRCIYQVLDGLSYLHRYGIVHRNIKPENLLFDDFHDDANLKIADFGLSVVMSHSIQTQTVCGTPGYCAPELLEGVTYGTQVDLWSVGVILYILLCGYEPFPIEDEVDMFRKIRRGHFNFHSPFWDNISLNARDLILKLLLRDPNKRLTASRALSHPWVEGSATKVDHMEQTQTKLREFNARRKYKAAANMIIIAKKLGMSMAHQRGELNGPEVDFSNQEDKLEISQSPALENPEFVNATA